MPVSEAVDPAPVVSMVDVSEVGLPVLDVPAFEVSVREASVFGLVADPEVPVVVLDAVVPAVELVVSVPDVPVAELALVPEGDVLDVPPDGGVLGLPVLDVPVLDGSVVDGPVLEVAVLGVSGFEGPVLEVSVLDVPGLEVPVPGVPAPVVLVLPVEEGIAEACSFATGFSAPSGTTRS